MLINLHIRNLALIDALDIDFSEGLNVLTGETGAGKSIIIGSIGVGLGGKFDAGLLRDPEKEGLVELLFQTGPKIVEKLAEMDIPVENGEVTICRRSFGGRVTNRINGHTVTLAFLKEVAGELLSLHAQHEQQTLLKPAMHLQLVDEAAAEETGPLLRKTGELYREHQKVLREIEDREKNSADRMRQLDYLKYEIGEIEALHLVPGEDEELEAFFRKASSAKELAELLGEAAGLAGYDRDSSAGSQVSRAARLMARAEKLDPELAGLVSILSDVESLLNDFGRGAADYEEGLSVDEGSLLAAEERLNRINSLKRKYGSTVEDILSALEDMTKEADELERWDERGAELAALEAAQRKELEKAAEALSAVRKKAAERLTKEIEDTLRELNFPDVRFSMSFERKEEIGPSGYDDAVFLFSANQGEKEKPLHQCASGGELSRVMLAVRSVLSEKGETPTLIFDEIDVGISGITAAKVGRQLEQLARTHQIISITHLPQIAALGKSAFMIEKEVKDGRTLTSIRRLDREGRVRELARLMGGEKVTESVLRSAEELLLAEERKEEK